MLKQAVKSADRTLERITIYKGKRQRLLRLSTVAVTVISAGSRERGRKKTEKGGKDGNI